MSQKQFNKIKALKSKQDDNGLLNIALSQTDFSVKLAALSALGDLSSMWTPEIPEQLIKQLMTMDESDVQSSIALISTLGKKHDSSVISSFIDLFSRVNKEKLKQNIISQLEMFVEPEFRDRIIDFLLKILKEDGGPIIHHVIEALGAIRDPRAVEGLINLLKFPSFRLDSIRALLAIGDPHAIEPIANLLKEGETADMDKWVRIEVANILRQFGVTTHEGSCITCVCIICGKRREPGTEHDFGPFEYDNPNLIKHPDACNATRICKRCGQIEHKVEHRAWDSEDPESWCNACGYREYYSILEHSWRPLPNFYKTEEEDDSITSMNLSGKGLTSLPENIGKFESLQILSLVGNELTSLPEAIGRCKWLTNLDLDNNKLSSLVRHSKVLAYS